LPSSSAPAGASGNPATSGPRAAAYQPAAQPAADAALQAAVAAFPLYGNLTPAGQAYPTAQNLVGPLSDPNNPYLQQAMQAAGSASNLYSPFLNLNPLAGVENQYAAALPGYLQSAQDISMNAPMLASNAANLLQFGSGQAGALEGLTTPAAGDLFNLGRTAENWGVNEASRIYDLTQPGATNLGQYAGQILNTAFDPQNALQQQLEQQVQQQARAANVAAGLGGTGYGAGQESGALSNFDINWENQKLARQQAGLGAAGAAYGQIPGLLNAPTQAFGTGLNLAEGAFGQVPGLIGAPVNLLSQATSGAINPLVAASNLAVSPGAALTSLTSPLGALAGTAGQEINPYVSYAGLPFNTQGTAVNTQLGGLNNLVNLGQQQYAIPQQVINDLQSYLGLGQAASGLSGQLGNLGQQQLFNSLSGLGGAANLGSQALFGNSLFGSGGSGGLFGSSGLLGNPFSSSSGGLLGGLFGSSSPALTPGVGGAFATSDFTDLLGGGAAAAGGAGLADAGAAAGIGADFGSTLLDFLPLALA
jgi:hypothetical protein